MENNIDFCNMEKSNMSSSSPNENSRIIVEENSYIPFVPMAGAVSRWAARSFDLILEIYIIAFPLVIILQIFDHITGLNSYHLISGTAGDFFILPVVLLFDGIVYAIFGGTLGKWLFGLRIVKRDSNKISRKDYFYRNLRVYWGGLGIGFPLVTVFTMWTQYKRVSNGVQATYDEILDTGVIEYKKTPLKTFLGILLFLLLFVFHVWNSMPQDEFQQPSQASLDAASCSSAFDSEYWSQTENPFNSLKSNADFFTKNFETFQQKAETGDIEAQFNLGLCYRAGLGTEQDAVVAAEWFQKAADSNHVWAQVLLGASYYEGIGVPQSFVNSAKYMQKAAEQGNAMAQSSLGFCFLRGEGVEKNLDKGIMWLRKAAEQNEPMAQYNLGSIYLSEMHDADEAAIWFRKSAEQGFADAQLMLGCCYHDGLGVKQDRTEAKKWLQKAADQGNENAEKAMKDLGY